MRFNPFTKSPEPSNEPLPKRRRNSSPSPAPSEAGLRTPRAAALREREVARLYVERLNLLTNFSDEAVAIVLDLGNSPAELARASHARTLWPEFIRGSGGFRNNRDAMAAFRGWFFRRPSEVAPGRSNSDAAATAALLALAGAV